MGDADDDDGWAQHLGSAVDAQVLPASLEEAVRPMSGLLFVDREGQRRKLEFGQVKNLLRQKRREMAGIIRRELVGAGADGAVLEEDCALAVHLYTVDHPFRIFELVNSRMCAPGRSDATAPGGIAPELRKCLPYVKFLRHSLLSLPPKFHFEGRCFRGVKWAFPRVGRLADGSWACEHDLEAHFPPGRQLRWFEFKSASMVHDTMYQPCFCGAEGPRTIFTIEGVRGYIIKPFSALPDEAEVLFLPNTRFQVARVVQKLMPEHLVPNAAPGGYPDDVLLVSPDQEVALAVPKELLLRLGRQEVGSGDAAVLGHGNFAEVRRGTYAFSSSTAPTQVAFKIFKNTQRMDKELRKQIIKEAQLGVRLQQHPNLIRLFGVLEIPNKGLSLVLELAEGGSLRQILNDTDSCPVLPWGLRLRWIAEMAEGLGVLHGLIPRAVLHRDMKAANVLLSRPLPAPEQLEALDESGQPVLNGCVAKLADFGIAEIMETMATRASAGGGGSGEAGTLAWKAPETFNGRYSPASDVFGLAVTCFEIFSRKHPYEGLTHPEITRLAMLRFEVQTGMLRFATEEQQQQVWIEDNPLSSRRPDLDQLEAGCPEDAVALMQRCWADEMKERPTVDECLAELSRIARVQQLAEVRAAAAAAEAQAAAEAAAAAAAEEAAAAAAAAAEATAEAAAEAAAAATETASAAEEAATYHVCSICIMCIMCVAFVSCV